MANMGYGQAAADQVNALKAELKQLTVHELKRVLKNENLALGGLKGDLQIRLTARKFFLPHPLDCPPRPCHRAD
jgi:hypothetical protein